MQLSHNAATHDQREGTRDSKTSEKYEQRLLRLFEWGQEKVVGLWKSKAIWRPQRHAQGGSGAPGAAQALPKGCGRAQLQRSDKVMCAFDNIDINTAYTAPWY